MENKKTPNPAGFVDFAIKRVKNDDTAFRAALLRGDNPNTASYVWQYLVPYCNLDLERERLAFSLAGAGIARERPEKDGELDFGAALRSVCRDEDDRERETRRFRRLIGCDTPNELFQVLRPMLKYVQSKGDSPGYVRLINDFLYWGERVKIRWTKHFFGQSFEESGKEAADGAISD